MVASGTLVFHLNFFSHYLSPSKHSLHLVLCNKAEWLLEMLLRARDFTCQVITSEILSTGGLVQGRLSFLLVPVVCAAGSELSLWLSFFLFCQTLDGRIVVRSHARVSSLTLKEIQYTDAGEYVCTASNTIGQDSQAMYLEVQCKKGEGWFMHLDGGEGAASDFLVFWRDRSTYN